jgi:NAD(P)-dependent dehydrogenase (short-subunit alcohol dehydrogenase family)
MEKKMFETKPSNRVVLVTGAENGIGLAMARALVEQGDCVAAIDLSVANLTALAQTRSGLLPIICDVTKPDLVRGVVEQVIATWGRIDVLVNNAARASFGPFETKTIDSIRDEFETNYFGYLNLINAVLRVMKRQGHGVIHNFSSGVGLTGYPGIAGYASTKGAIEALTRTLALEYAREGITFNLMHPPLTATKSAAPLGIPAEMMADPEIVGRKLARKVGSQKPVVTPDFTSALGIWGMAHFPIAMGRFLSGMANRAREKTSAVETAP